MTEQKVRQLIGDDQWDEFIKWMGGQTVGINEDGSINYYEGDVNRFLSNLPVID